ncbi:ANTAR domain-containing protein [Cellulomonas sp. ACRRI]|uniref:ANTAR domain-containing protein n=1 Tax=Cellulomonas sp. ACRRI TaxID=2918188 RepID=UPI001EF1C965|nr:ANTAR domain-containing protein [Cellulomonas sp. ACRRI]MCG7285105.1 ANTAR domain-containing protein [Cellulomonas sp. ACRRI]
MSLTSRPASGPAQPNPTAPGTFHVLGDGDALAWSEPVYRLHGFEPGDVVPSTALMLAHCHREDRPALEAVLRAAPVAGGDGSSVRYRLLDAGGAERSVLAVLAPGVDARHAHRSADGDADHGGRPAGPPVAPDGRTPERLGLLVDLGAEISATAARRADDMLAAAIASREVIDQAKGAAMLAYGLDGGAAFDFLRWHSEHLNVKVRSVAERLLESLPGREADRDPRDVLDAALAGLADVTGGAEVAGLDGATRPAPAGGRTLPATLVVRHTVEGRAVVAQLAGEVDAGTAPALVAGLTEALRAVPPRGTLVLDASGLQRLGPVAALHIARLRRRAEHAGVQLRVVAPLSGRAEMREDVTGASM